MKNLIIKLGCSSIITAIVAFLAYYLFLPAMNLSSPGLWLYLISLGAIFTVVMFSFEYLQYEESYIGSGISIAITCILLLILIIGSIIGSPMANSVAYQKRLEVKTTTFEEEIPEVDWNTVPQIDKDSSVILGNRKMGTLTQEISQYNVMDNYTQINLGEKPIRVSPLGYADFFKYMNNKEAGIPGYISVNGVSKEAEFIRLKEGMQYSPSAFFAKDLKRHLRNKYPTTLFGDFSFEVDDEKKPYYIIPTYRYAAGIGGAKTATGCIVINPFTGEGTLYDSNNIPTWIDHAIDSDHAVNMIDTWGMYQNGFWNAQFGQKNVRKSTEGYNYITIGNDVYLYTGITSVVQDESNIGFMLFNMRTGLALYFDMPSAEEYSAMDSAMGQVQHLNYTSTFPILIKVNGVPTYFLSLKDNAGLVKMYGFVAVENIQTLSVTESSLGVEYGMQEYIKILSKDTSSSIGKAEEINTPILISEIYTAIVEGNSYYYIVSSTGELYIASITAGKECLPLLKPGDTINISAFKATNYYDVTTVTK